MSKATILSSKKEFHHYTTELEIPLYIDIMPQGIRFYKNLTVRVVFKKRVNRNFRINTETFKEKISRDFIISDNFSINYMTFFEHEGMYLENFPTFIIMERTLAEHRRKIIDSL